MKFDLKDYQIEASDMVLRYIRWGSKQYAEEKDHTAVSLSAPTGAGKTVIAAAVIEKILFGDPEADVPADPDAVFLWLTDDPSLNEQTRKKILEASDRIQPSQLITLGDGFDKPQLPGGKVYFLNIQKMGKKSNLVNKKERRRTYTMWTTIANTIKNNGTHFYLVRDEAHRGTGKPNREDQTIASKLTNGDSGFVLPAPVVWGISATPDRFEKAMNEAVPERLLRRVVVPPEKVRESGLIKDVVSITHRGENQLMNQTLVRQAVANLRLMDSAWNAYTAAEDAPSVRPVLVFQIPKNIAPSEVGNYLDLCVDEWADLGQKGAIAHALESHTTMEFGNHAVPYVQPQNIQDHPTVRLVVFKEALTTGWDCQRAEVMISLRKAADVTYIAQLIGRMVRSPLARRIVSNDSLNRVRLYLPEFDEVAVKTVVDKLKSGDTNVTSDVEIDSVDAYRNPNVDSKLFDSLETLTSFTVPGNAARSQVTRLHKLAALLSGDEILPGAVKLSDAFLVSVLTAEQNRLDGDGTLTALLSDVRTATITVRHVSNIDTKEEDVVETEEIETAAEDINHLYEGSRRRFKDGLAQTFWGHCVKNGADPLEAKILTVALSMDASVVAKVEAEAEGRVQQWLSTHGDAISQLTEDKSAGYTDIRDRAKNPEEIHPKLPVNPISMTGDKAVSTWDKHLYSDKSGSFRCKLGKWEEHVLAVESARSSFLAWYRNPAGGQRCLRLPFRVEGGFGKLYPDFVFFHVGADGTPKPSIVDPHGHHLSDAGPKLRGLAEYAANHGSEYTRIVSIIQIASGEFRLLDLKDAAVRSHLDGVNSKEEIEAVFVAHGAVYA